MSQNAAILYRLENNPNGITAWEAAHDPLIRSMRLSGRIEELRKQGYDIRTIMQSDGKKHYARYILGKYVPETAALTPEPTGQWSFV